MKKIGLVGGLGPASTVYYYLSLIKRCQSQNGESAYPKIVIDSADMSEHTEAFEKNDYDKICKLLLKSLADLKAAGAELAAITANTEHIVWNKICGRFPLPVISIVDAAVNQIKRDGYKRVLILGTEFTMRSGIYSEELKKCGIIPVIPDNDDMKLLGGLVYPNLENGIVIEDDRKMIMSLAERYIKIHNTDAVLLGCTELPLAIKNGDLSVPVLNTADIHINEIY
ncbi:MAG: aspartate/glutamate racemase family protein, partial [Candidatus Ornithomonoglobus sp.]